MNEFIWAIYPYICATLFFVVPILRRIHSPFEWSTRASGIFGRSILGVASLALHWGLFLVFAGHVAGLVGGLMGLGGWIAFFYWTGLVGGLLALAGSLVAFVRRLTNPEVRAMSQPDDYIVHLFLMAIIGIAVYQVLATQIFGLAYTASSWFASLWQFSPQPELMASSSLLTKIHIFLALTFFAYFPFTKLVHFWTYPINYFTRPFQSMRTQAKQFTRDWEFAMRSDQSWMVLAMAVLIGGFLAAAAALGNVFVDGHAVASGEDSHTAAESGTEVLTGYPLYVSQCARCHGLEGAGEGPGAGSPTFAAPPRDLTGPNLRFASTRNGVASRSDIRRTLVEGLDGSGMPGFPRLSDRQIDSLVDVVRSFQEDRPEPGAVVEPPSRPRTTDELVETGRAIYQAKCATCHGDDGRGDGPAASGLEPPPANLAAGRLKAANSSEDLYRRIRVGIPESGMAGFGDLSERETWAVVAYLEREIVPDRWVESSSEAR